MEDYKGYLAFPSPRAFFCYTQGWQGCTLFYTLQCDSTSRQDLLSRVRPIVPPLAFDLQYARRLAENPPILSRPVSVGNQHLPIASIREQSPQGRLSAISETHISVLRTIPETICEVASFTRQ